MIRSGRVLAQLGVREAPAGHHARREAVDHDVRPLQDQFPRDVATNRVGHVDGHAQLVRIELGEEAAAVDAGLAVDERRTDPQRVRVLAGLDFDDGGAEVAEVAGGDGSSGGPGEVDDLQSGEDAARAGALVWPSAPIGAWATALELAGVSRRRDRMPRTASSSRKMAWLCSPSSGGRRKFSIGVGRKSRERPWIEDRALELRVRHRHQQAARLDLAALHDVLRRGRRRQPEAELDRLLVQLVQRAGEQEALDGRGDLVVLVLGNGAIVRRRPSLWRSGSASPNPSLGHPRHQRFVLRFAPAGDQRSKRDPAVLARPGKAEFHAGRVGAEADCLAHACWRAGPARQRSR